jgi:HEAT repeats
MSDRHVHSPGFSHMPRHPAFSLALVVAFLFVAAARGQDAPNSPAVTRGVEYLRRSVKGLAAGESGLVALALIKAEVPHNDPALQSCIATALDRFQGSNFVSSRRGGTEYYEASVIGMALANLDPVTYRAQVEAIARFLLAKQQGSGCWDYDNRTPGDTSMTQYALLGLWEAENIGINIPGKVWDTGAQWYITNQQASGAWNYHPDEKAVYGDTVAMTAAGVGSLLLCKRQLARYRKSSTEGGSSFLVPLVAEGTNTTAQHFEARTTNKSIDDAVKRGLSWLNGHMNAADEKIVGPSMCYSMYGVERVSALAGDTLNAADLYQRGMQRVLATQSSDGGWGGGFGEQANTSWAILLLTKATAKTVRKIDIKRLKGGTLLGGRGLPDNVENLTIAQGRVIVRPMNGAVEQMLSVLADPRALNAEAALAGLIDKYRTDGPKALRPYKDRLKKLLNDRDPGVRRVACWGLGRTGDLDVVLDLIEVLQRDQDDQVVGEAKIGLQVLSRKIVGFGPAPGATAEERESAAKQWRSWYDAVRPPDRSDADEEGSR